MEVYRAILPSPPPPVTAQFEDNSNCAVTILSEAQMRMVGGCKLLKATTTRDVLNDYVYKKDVLTKLLPHIDIQELVGR